jgi:hypothetical protein
MSVPLSQALPWKRLATAAGCAAVAAIPTMVICRGAAMPPIAALAVAAPTYALVYAALLYTVGRRTRPAILEHPATI